MSDKNLVKAAKRTRIKLRIRKRVHGTAEKPRLSVYRSLNHIYAQLVDDQAGHTLLSISSLSEHVQKSKKEAGKIPTGKLVGMELAKAAKAKGIEAIVFDRNGYQYHGRVKAVAEGAREGGLKF
jgi:large subunit ribosomal protein L18